MLIGYARTSTVDQKAGFEAQLAELARAGCTKIFKEQVSAVGKRSELEAAIEFCRDGDCFIVCKLDRLARSMQHLQQIVAELERKKVALRILNLNLDSATPTGKLMLNLLGSIAQWEREMLLERQREGIAKAKANKTPAPATNITGNSGIPMRALIQPITTFLSVCNFKIVAHLLLLFSSKPLKITSPSNKMHPTKTAYNKPIPLDDFSVDD